MAVKILRTHSGEMRGVQVRTALTFYLDRDPNHVQLVMDADAEGRNVAATIREAMRGGITVFEMAAPEEEDAINFDIGLEI